MIDIGGDRRVPGAPYPNLQDLQTVWGLTSDAMAISDADGMVTIANPAYAQLYGYSLADIIGQDFAIMIPLEQRAWVRLQYQAIFRAKDVPPRIESTIVRADGTRRVIETRIAFLNDLGRRTAMLSTIRDITVRAQSEAERGPSEEQLRLAMRAAAITLSTQDAELRYTWTYRPAIGFPDHEALGRTDADLFEPAEAAPLMAVKRRVLEQGQPERAEVTLTGANGPRTFELLVEPQRAHGRVVGLVCAAIDITSRKQIEAQIEAGHLRMQVLVEAFDLFARAGQDSRSLFDAIVRHLAQLLGDGCVLRLTDNMGQNDQLVAVYHANPEALAFYRKFSETSLQLGEGVSGRVIETGQPVLLPVLSLEQVRANSPTRFWPYLERFPIHSGLVVPLQARGQTFGAIALSRDITPRAYTEVDLILVQELAARAALALDNARLYEQARRLNATLEQRVQERTAELAASNKQLRALTADLQTAREVERQNLGRDLHDVLGGALTGLKMTVARLRVRPGTGELDPSATLNTALAQIDDAIQLVRRLATDLHPPALEFLGLVAALQGLAQEFADAADLDCRFETMLDTLELDPGAGIAVYRVAQESLTNVARHAEATAVRISLAEEAGWAVLRIADNGQGFDLAAAAQKHSLGLVSMRERVHAISGQLEITSAPGQGTTVTVKVPCRQYSPPE